MKTILLPLLATLAAIFRSRALLQVEILALHQQLAMITQRDRKRLRFHWVKPRAIDPEHDTHAWYATSP